MNGLPGGVATQEKLIRAAITLGRPVDRPYGSTGETGTFSYEKRRAFRPVFLCIRLMNALMAEDRLSRQRR